MLTRLLSLPPSRLNITWRSYVGILLLSLLSAALLMADDVLFHAMGGAHYAVFEPVYGLVIFLLALAFWLCRQRWLVALVLMLFVFMQVIQFANLAFTGEPLSVSDLQNAMHNPEDIRQALLAGWWPYAWVLVVVGVPYGLLFVLHGWMQPRLGLPHFSLAWLVILLILAAKPIRASYRDLEDFLPGPTRSALHNSMNVFSFFAMKGLQDQPLRPAAAAHAMVPYTLTPHADSTMPRHIWLVVADSLRPDRMSVYGAERQTTPHLQTWMTRMQGVRLQGIAAGVSTAVSLPALMNVIREPGQEGWMKDKRHNLFRLAQDQGYETYWLSSQESKLLTYLGRPFIDHVVTRENRLMGFMQRRDALLADIIEQQMPRDKSFAVFNMRAVHFPYEENYQQDADFVPSWPTVPQLPHEVRMRNAYDNALLHWDGVMDRILHAFSKLEGEKYLIVTADHGQLLGEGGRWGHNRLQPEVVEVPMMVFSSQGSGMETLEQDAWVSHYELGVWLAQRLGVNIDNPNAEDELHFNHGDQLLGDRLVLPIRELPDRIEYHAPVLMSTLKGRAVGK
ncbi:MAG TPA: sulfatase-like hydrolase/transferase [Methylovorus sp.]|jgi:glucan phosphoethanolaminetransferase (alkaline phosphatase superfamily)|nr:sulfatase-like hydrolase/transferase [Methylovorus sp.]